MAPALLTISQLARLADVSVRTLRFWSDEGLIPVASRSASGYRLYDEGALVRLRLVGTLRALGLGHEAITAILRGRRSIADVAATHADALTAQLRVLRMQRAVLRAVARRGQDTREDVMIHELNHLATATAAERQSIVDDFVARACDGLPEQSRSRGILEAMRQLPDALPDDPSDAHVDAWLELAALCRDPDFAARVRQMAVEGSAPPPQPIAPQPDHRAVLEHVRAALASDVAPDSAAAESVLARLGLSELDAQARVALGDRMARFHDVRVERYWTLLGVLHERPPFEPVAPCYAWLIAALRARAPADAASRS
ncbi:MAG: MerR family transcriptional regulator [Nannocystaceae bacterium]|nr:MerR family transcriptional regulator [Nannocystaceae bacterium]